MISLSRRSVLSAVVAGMAAGVTTKKVFAQGGYPNRVIKMVVPWPPGGVTDTTGRIIAQWMSADLGQTMIVENRPGAAGTIGHTAVSQAEPDGYTLLLATNSTYAMAPHLLGKLPYDSDKAFLPIGLAVRSPQIFCAHPSVPVKDIPSFLAYVRARQPDGVTFESSGPGSSSHLATELLMSMAKFNMLHVPYRGGGPALQALVAGEVNVGFVDAVVALPMAEAGKIQMLGVSTQERLPLVPDLQTISESGVPGFQSSTDVAMLAPAGTPAPVIKRVSAAFLNALGKTEVRSALLKQGAIMVAGSPEQFPAYYAQESAKWGEIIRSRGITIK